MCELILPSAYKAALWIAKSSASGGELALRPLPGLRPWTPPGDFRPQTPSICSPVKFPGYAADVDLIRFPMTVLNPQSILSFYAALMMTAIATVDSILYF
jgi:hypothetical protein